MNGDQIAQLSYLVLLGAAIAGFYFVQNREQIGQSLRYALIWGLLFVGVIAGALLWEDVRSGVSPQAAFSDNGFEIPRSRDGHYYVTLQIDGVPVDFVVDTGATDVVLSREDARRIGIDPDTLRYTGQAQTANGTVQTARVSLDAVALGPWLDNGVEAWVNDADLFGSLLGMSYLENYSLSIDSDQMILRR